MAKTIGVRELRNDLARMMEEVAERREHLVVTRHGRAAAAIVPIDEYQGLEETADILSDPDALQALETGLAQLARGETVTLEELRTELARLRTA